MFLRLVLALATLVAVVHAGSFPLLSAGSLDAFVERHNFAAVFFCAASAPNCETALAVLEAVSAKHNSVSFARIDIVADAELARTLDVDNIPAMHVYHGGTEVGRIWDVPGDEFDDFSPPGVGLFLSRTTTPPVVLLHSEADRELFVRSFERAVVGSFPGSPIALWTTVHYPHGGDAAETFAHVASRLRNEFAFAVEAFEPQSQTQRIVLHKNHEGDAPEARVFEGDLTSVEALELFLLRSEHAPFAEISASNYFHFERLGIPLAVVFLSEKAHAREELQALQAVFAPIAKRRWASLAFGFMSAEGYAGYVRRLAGPAARFPLLVVDALDGVSHFVAEGLRLSDSAAVDAWLDSVLAGEPKPHVRSADPRQAASGSEHVTEVVASTLAAFVESATAAGDLALLVYDSTSPSAAEFEVPGLALLAGRAARTVPGLRFAQLDYAANDFTILRGPQSIVHLPSLFFFRRGEVDAHVLASDEVKVASRVRDFILAHSTIVGLSPSSFRKDETTSADREL